MARLEAALLVFIVGFLFWFLVAPYVGFTIVLLLIVLLDVMPMSLIALVTVLGK